MNNTPKTIARVAGMLLVAAFMLGAGSPAFALSINLSTGKVNPPDAIGDLSVPYFTTSGATLSWEVSSANVDTDMIYDIRYSTQPITDANFANAQEAQSAPIAFSDLKHNGAERAYTVNGLTPGTTYYFALKSKYSISDWSSISDIPSMALPAQAPTTSTFPNTDLGYGQTGLSVSDLQSFLTKQGIYNGPITTFFGSMTKKAVILFQKKNSIMPAEGFVGPITRQAIKTLLAAQK